MKIKLLFLGFVYLLGALSRAETPAAASNPAEEKQLITVLRSDAGPREKDEACARLKRIGTERSVPALAALLTDEKLSHSARYALEPMQTPAAEKALVSALHRTSGALKVGIIDSLGVRADRYAVSALIKLLNDPDQAVASAAAAALGRIGDDSALKALLLAMRQSSGEMHSAQVRACLACAQAELRIRRGEQAKIAFDAIYKNESSPGIRTAAYRGLIYSSGEKSRGLILKGLTGDPGPAQTAALQVLHECDFGIVPDVAMVMTDVSPSVLAATIDGLTQVGNPRAVELARLSIANDSAQVRLAAIRCLGALGDSAAIPLLEKPAAYASDPEKEVARAALVRLHYGKISEGLVAQLRTADAPIRAEAARALGLRGDPTVVPVLLESAAGDPEVVRAADLKAIGLLGQPKDVDAVVALVVNAKTEDARSGAAEALDSILQHSISAKATVDLRSLTNAVVSATADARIALADICSRLATPETRGALRAAARDQDPKVRESAIRAICESSDIELLPDLLGFATDKENEKVRALAINGCVRVLTQEEGVKVANNEKVDAFKRILAASPNDAEKRSVLSGLARIADVESLKLADGLLDDAAVQAEAVQAVVKIAGILPAADRPVVKASIDKILSLPIDEQTRTSVTKVSKKL